jgi:hypothetical protein
MVSVAETYKDEDMTESGIEPDKAASVKTWRSKGGVEMTEDYRSSW